MNAFIVPIAVSLIAAVPGFLAYRQATAANQASASAKRIEIEAGAYARARDLYEAALDQLQNQLTSIQTQLNSERDVSNSLRNQVNALEDTVARLRRQLILAGLGDADPQLIPQDPGP